MVRRGFAAGMSYARGQVSDDREDRRRSLLEVAGAVTLAALFAGCAYHAHEKTDRGGGDEPLAEAATDPGMTDDTSEATVTTDPAAPIASEAASRPYVRGAGAPPVEGPALLGVEGFFTEPVAGNAPVGVGGPLYVVRVEDTTWVGVSSDDRRRLGAASGAADALHYGVPRSEGPPELPVSDLVERASAEGAPTLCVLRFTGAGRARRAALVLVETATERTLVVQTGLEPSLDLLGAALGARLR